MTEKMVDRVTKAMSNPVQIRNICTSAHIDHGKTTFSDNLISGAGMMAEELAGKALQLDFHEDEQERGITIDAANVSMVHVYEGKEYLINLFSMIHSRRTFTLSEVLFLNYEIHEIIHWFRNRSC